MDSLTKFVTLHINTLVYRFGSKNEVEEFSRESALPLFLEYCSKDETANPDEDLTNNGCLSVIGR